MSQIIYGKNSIEEALKSDNITLNKIWLLKDGKGQRFKELEKLAKAKKIPIIYSDKKSLNKIADTEDHRSVVAEIASANYLDENQILEQEKAEIILVPVNIEDPHNLGAIIRSAKAFGVDIVAIPNRRAVQINSTVMSASAGAAMSMNIARIGNITNFITKMKKENYWIYAADIDKSRAEDLNKLEFSGKIILLVGNEAKGVGDNLLKQSDFIIRIPVDFESLNVSVATGIILSKIYSDVVL